MQFLFIISHDSSFQPTDELIGAIHGWIGKQQQAGTRIIGAPLVPPGEAVTVEVRANDRGAQRQGPFSDARLQMCGFELVDCADMEAAVALAATHPMAKAATIEVRAVWEGL